MSGQVYFACRGGDYARTVYKNAAGMAFRRYVWNNGPRGRSRAHVASRGAFSTCDVMITQGVVRRRGRGPVRVFLCWSFPDRIEIQQL